MTPAVEQLVRETIELTGAQGPSLMADDAPVLAEDALIDATDAFYLVGLIGGKDVGKSALVNSLAGRDITDSSDFGPGTEIVIAYAHQSQEAAVRELLEREVPGTFRIITHNVSGLRRQVLLDLPDIDSHFTSHVRVTRTMLRHMLFPVWIVSIEKYADRQPQQMLTMVASGNAPGNFIFCLNKVDQLNRSEADADAAAELRDDYAGRVQRTLSLAEPPRVYMISAIHPQDYELPELRRMLAQQKSVEIIRQSQEQAAQRQDRTLLAWLDNQQLPQRAARLKRLEASAAELAADRIASPLLDEVIPRLLDDPATRGAMAEEILTERVSHWPLVRLVHTLLSPVFVLLRGAASRNAAPLQTPLGMVEIALKEAGYTDSDLIQTTFAQLRQSEPAFGELYSHNRLWEQMSAEMAASEWRRTIAATIQRQRDAARAMLIRKSNAGAPFRWLLTIGAVLWFPFIQPILEGVLSATDFHVWTIARKLALLVQVLGVNYLITSAGFLILYFVVLWLALRWNTQRKVARLLGNWQTAQPADRSLDLATQTVEWIENLLSPLRQARQRIESLTERVQSARESLGKAA